MRQHEAVNNITASLSRLTEHTVEFRCGMSSGKVLGKCLLELWVGRGVHQFLTEGRKAYTVLDWKPDSFEMNIYKIIFLARNKSIIFQEKSWPLSLDLRMRSTATQVGSVAAAVLKLWEFRVISASTV